MPNPILVSGEAGRAGGIGRTVTELLLKQGKGVYLDRGSRSLFT